MLSRLKGIETFFIVLLFFLQNWRLCICFPVWRELKLSVQRWMGVRVTAFVYAFPFEGNWNDFMNSPSCSVRPGFVYAFPFEGNWNRGNSFCLVPFPLFVYAFPFEGNWNARLLRWRCWLRLTLYMLSRLKGIETSLLSLPFTFTASLYMLSRLKGIETRAKSVRAKSVRALCICFPVWRELKRYDNFGLIWVC